MNGTKHVSFIVAHISLLFTITLKSSTRNGLLNNEFVFIFVHYSFVFCPKSVAIHVAYPHYATTQLIPPQTPSTEGIHSKPQLIHFPTNTPTISPSIRPAFLIPSRKTGIIRPFRVLSLIIHQPIQRIRPLRPTVSALPTG